MLAVITDSTCDIPQALIDQYQIIVVPHTIIWGEEQYRDRVDLQPEAFYRRLETSDIRPTTAQAGEGEFSSAIAEAVTRGATEAVILTVSSAMSGAFHMAEMAAQSAKIPVAVVDSKGPTMSLGWQVLAAARSAEVDSSMDEAVKAAAIVRENLAQFVAMDTLEYLQYGGRIGDAVKWVGNILKVKPLVSIDHVSGRVQPAGLARTRRSLMQMLESKFFDALEGKQGKLHIAVLHGNVPEEGQALADKINAAYHPEELLLNITGPVLGINTGPGALALCGYVA